MFGTENPTRFVTLGLVVAMAVSVSACLPSSSGRGDGTSAPKIADQAEFESIRDRAERTMTRAMELAITATGAELGEPDEPVRVSTIGCDLQPESVREITVVSGLRYRGAEPASAAQAIVRAWRDAGWDADVAEQTAVGFDLELAAGVMLNLSLGRVTPATDGDGLRWGATATTDCLDLPDDVARKIQTGDLE